MNSDEKFARDFGIQESARYRRIGDSENPDTPFTPFRPLSEMSWPEQRTLVVPNADRHRSIPWHLTLQMSIKTGKPQSVYISDQPIRPFRPVYIVTDVASEGLVHFTSIVCCNEVCLEGPIDAFLFSHRKYLLTKGRTEAEQLLALEIDKARYGLGMKMVRPCDRIVVRAEYTGRKPSARRFKKEFEFGVTFFGWTVDPQSVFP